MIKMMKKVMVMLMKRRMSTAGSASFWNLFNNIQKCMTKPVRDTRKRTCEKQLAMTLQMLWNLMVF